MSQPVQTLQSVPLKSNKPVLIIDKKGSLGVALARKISSDYVVVLVTGREVKHFKNLIVVPYKRKIPTIPDNTYVQIIAFYGGDSELLGMLDPLVKKAEEGRTRLTFVYGVRQGTDAFYKRMLQRFASLSLVLVGDVFGGDVLEYNLVNDFITQARAHGKIVIPNTGLYKTYPVYVEDVIDGVIAAVFLQKLDKRVYLLFPRHAVTALSVGRMMQQSHPEIKVDFLKTTERRLPVAIPEGGEYLLSRQYPLAKRIYDLDLTRKKGASRMMRRPKGNPYKRPLTYLLLGGVLLFLMPFIATALFVLFGYVLLDSGRQQLEAGKYQQAQQALGHAKNAFAIALETADTAAGIGRLVRLSSFADTVTERIATGERAASAGELLLTSYMLLSSVAEGKSQDPKGDFVSGINDLRRSVVIARELSESEGTPTQLKEALRSYVPAMQLVSATAELYPSLFGFNGKKTYLLLFQNNMELRPGGGFIGSYGLATIENGRVSNFSVHNVYDTDGKLTGHVEPPYPLRRYMGVHHLFMRDSNFFVDFRKNAAQTAYLLELATGEKVDGVIGVDMNFFRSLFEVTGPISLPTFNETVTADNVYLVTQRYAEKNFFPGSRQKQDFLSALFEAFVAKLGQSGGANPALIKKVATGIREKHLLIAVPDIATQRVLTLHNLSGAMSDTYPHDPGGVADTFGLVEANIGENKTNYYLRRTIKHDVDITTSGEIVEAATVTYVNTSGKESEFGGPYEAYLRLITPANTELTDILVDGAPQEIVPAITDSFRYERSSFVPPSGIEVETATEEGKRIFGIYVVVPEGATRTVAFRYRLAKKVVLASSFQFSLQYFKQPGAQADPYVLTITYPQAITPRKMSSMFTKRGQEVVSFGPFNEDKLFTIDFGK